MDQAVTVHFLFESKDVDDLYALEDRLTDMLEKSGQGECDGHDVAVDLSDASIYLYGPDAELLLKATEHVFKESACVGKATATLRFGLIEEGAKERVVTIK